MKDQAPDDQQWCKVMVEIGPKARVFIQVKFNQEQRADLRLDAAEARGLASRLMADAAKLEGIAS